MADDGTAARISADRQRQVAPTPNLSAELARGIAAAPIDQYVIWDGVAYRGQAASRCSRVLSLIDQPWTPVSLRELVLRGSRLGPDPVRPDQVRNAFRQHQRAVGACYFLVRRTMDGDYLTVTEVPRPASRSRGLAEGGVVLGRTGLRFGAMA